MEHIIIRFAGGYERNPENWVTVFRGTHSECIRERKEHRIFESGESGYEEKIIPAIKHEEALKKHWEEIETQRFQDVEFWRIIENARGVVNGETHCHRSKRICTESEHPHKAEDCPLYTRGGIIIQHPTTGQKIVVQPSALKGTIYDK